MKAGDRPVYRKPKVSRFDEPATGATVTYIAMDGHLRSAPVIDGMTRYSLSDHDSRCERTDCLPPGGTSPRSDVRRG
jgi:hypothetical protein